jgi:hypothetical protein
MGAREILRASAAALLGISAYEPAKPNYAGPSEADMEKLRRQFGGQFQPRARTRTRWYLSDLEMAEYLADGGDMSWASQLMTAARKDGMVSGILSTRTSGLVRLPKRFRGDGEVIAALELGHDQVRSVFDEMLPATDLGQVAADGELIGVGVGELVPVDGRDYPVAVRLDPQFLRYRWDESCWYFLSNTGPIPITPGDGRWILHTPGGRIAPWQHGLWRAIGRCYIRKEHAQLHKDEWEAKLANPARVAYAPTGSVEAQKDTFFKQVMAWGVNTVFGLTPGYEVKLLESNGRGFESFIKTIADQNQEITICLAGQTVTTDGGTGFSNADIHKSIRADLIKATADALAFTINTQVIPAFVLRRWGEAALATKPCVVEWDVAPPKDRTAEATALNTFALAVKALDEALVTHGRELDIDALCSRFGVPVRGDADGNGVPDVDQTKLAIVREAA